MSTPVCSRRIGSLSGPFAWVCVRCGRQVSAGDGPARGFYCPRTSQINASTVDEDELGGDRSEVLHDEDRPYVLVEELGRGGMGVVYRARAATTGDEVALKLLGEGASPVRQARFNREADLLAAVEDDGVVKILDRGTIGTGGRWFAMELVEGPTLAELLAEDVQVAPVERQRLLLAFCETLARLHSRGICHRDLKPSNVLVTVDGQPKISDFGLALDIAGDTRHTRTGQGLGTPAYMAPEVLGADHEPDWLRADVYSAGLVLAEWMSGRQGRHRSAGRLLDGRLWLDTVRDQLPPALGGICARATAFDPADRYADGQALLADVLRWTQGEMPVRRRRSAARWLAGRSTRVGLAALAVCLAVVLGYFARLTVARVQAERAAATALANVEARWNRLAAGGDAEAARRLVEAWASQPEVQGTDALARGWLHWGEFCRRSSLQGARGALAAAMVNARTDDTRRAATQALLENLEDEGDWIRLSQLIFHLDETGADSLIEPRLRLQVALAIRQFADATAQMDADDPRALAIRTLANAEPVQAFNPPQAVPCPTGDLLTFAQVGDVWLGGSRGWDRSLVAFAPPSCERAPADPGTDGWQSWIQAVAAADVDGDGVDEAVLGMGPGDAYGVRVLRNVEGQFEALVDMMVLGNVTGVTGWRRSDGSTAIVAVTSPRNPSSRVFPTSGQPPLPPGIHVLRWNGAGLEVEYSIPAPHWNGGPVVPFSVQVADIDGDGDEDVVVGAEEWVGLLLDAPDHPFVWMGDMRLIEIVQWDSDPAAELHVRIRAEDSMLGAGTQPLPTSPLGGTTKVDLYSDDPLWAQIRIMADLGLVDEAADRLAWIGMLRLGDEGAAAWRQAALLWQDTDPVRSAEAWAAATRDGDAASLLPALTGLWSTGRVEAANALLEEARSRGLAASVEAEVDALEMQTPVSLDAAEQRDKWELRAPYARLRAEGRLDIEVPLGITDVAAFPLRRTEGPLGVHLHGTLLRNEWASGIEVRLRSPSGSIVTFVQTVGNADAQYQEVGLAPAVWDRTRVDTPSPNQTFDLRFGMHPDHPAEVWLEVQWDGKHRPGRWIHLPFSPEGDAWQLELGAHAQGELRGAVMYAQLQEVEVWGFAVGTHEASLAPLSRDDEGIGRLRVERSRAVTQLTATDGEDQVLRWAETAWRSSLYYHRTDEQVLQDLLVHLPLSSEAAATIAPILFLSRIHALVETGDHARADAAMEHLRSQMPSRGSSCLAAHALDLALATAHHDTERGDHARAAGRACLDNGVVAKRDLTHLNLSL